MHYPIHDTKPATSSSSFFTIHFTLRYDTTNSPTPFPHSLSYFFPFFFKLPRISYLQPYTSIWVLGYTSRFHCFNVFFQYYIISNSTGTESQIQAFPFAGMLKLASHSHLRFVGLIPFCVFFTLEGMLDYTRIGWLCSVGNPEWAKVLI